MAWCSITAKTSAVRQLMRDKPLLWSATLLCGSRAPHVSFSWATDLFKLFWSAPATPSPVHTQTGWDLKSRPGDKLLSVAARPRPLHARCVAVLNRLGTVSGSCIRLWRLARGHRPPPHQRQESRWLAWECCGGFDCPLASLSHRRGGVGSQQPAATAAAAAAAAGAAAGHRQPQIESVPWGGGVAGNLGRSAQGPAIHGHFDWQCPRWHRSAEAGYFSSRRPAAVAAVRVSHRT